jgi:hypothetical protein
MRHTCLVSVRKISGRTCLAGGIIQEKLVDGTGDANPATSLFLPASLEVLKPKISKDFQKIRDLRFKRR